MLKFRNPFPDDCLLIYDWICDEITRSSSFGPPPTNYLAHESWFMARIKETTGAYLIFYTEDNPVNLVGQVRVDDRDEGLVVSIVTAPSQRGAGYGLEMLRNMVLLHAQGFFGQRPLRAWIKTNNLASKRIFTSAGFRLHESTKINGESCDLYILTFAG
jgi:RimJ/RimL family protein N-acetyltransferase